MPELQALTRSFQAADLGAAWLLTYLLHSTLLLGGAWLATRFLGRLGSGRRPFLAVQETVWRAALLGGLVTATLQLGLGWQPPLGSWQLDSGLAAETGAMSAAPLVEVASEAPASELLLTSPAPPLGTSSEVSVTATAGGALSSASTDRSGLRVPGADPAHPVLGATSPSFGSAMAPFLRWSLLITGLWLLGAFVLAGSLALSYHSFCRRIRNRSRVVGGDVRRLFDDLEPERAVGRTVALSASSRVQSPLAKGVTRPEVCLPLRVLSELSARQQKSLLAHELGHLVRRDPMWLLVARTLESVLFVQPLNRLARRRLQEISELRADDWAVRATGNPLDLARCLTRVADWNLAPVPVPSMAERAGSGLTRRIHRLLQSSEVEGDGVPRSLWLVVAALLMAVVLAAPGVSAVAGGSEPPAPPEAPEAPEAPEILEVPEAPEAPEAPETAEAPEAPPSPAAVIAPAPPSPAQQPSPRVAPAPAPAPGVTLPPLPPTLSRPPLSRPVLSRPVLSRPPHIAPIPSVPTPSVPSARLPRLAWMAPAPTPAPTLQASGEDRGETTSPRHRSDELTRQELEELEAELAELLADAFEPLETVHEDIEGLMETELETEMEALEIELETLDQNLEIELEALEELEGEGLVDLSNAEVAELNAHIQAMNAAILAEMRPLLELERALPIPQVEHLAEVSARRAEELAAEARRLARDGVSEAEAAHLREQARRLARDMEPQREEIERLRAEAGRMAREARERMRDDTRDLRQRLREQQREQLQELRNRLEALREEREGERQQRREELRSRMEMQRQQLEQQRRELRQRLDRELEQRREQMEQNRLQMKERQRQLEEHRLQMEEHRRELERQKQESQPDPEREGGS